MVQEKFKSKSGFILASVGAAIGLGDSLRFPGLCAKYGGGTFLFIYIVALLLIGIPVLNAEIALGRKFKGGAPKCMVSLNKRAEPLGWASSFNSLAVALLYAGILGWVLSMLVKIVPLCKISSSLTEAQTGAYFFSEVLGEGFSPLVAGCILLAWVAMFVLLRGGAETLSKAAKYTVIIPIVLYVFLAVRGLTYSNSSKALYALFVPDFSKFGDAELWLNALGQVFFSLSVLVGIMPAYGAYLPEKTNVFESSLIIAFSDFFVSVLSSVVLFTTLYGCGMENEISQSGIVTAFMVYPAAITLAFGNNVILNSVVGILFYLSLALMALQSSVSMIEAAANPLSEKTGVNKKRLAVFISVAGAGVCLVFATGIAPAVLDVADHFLNYFNILILGTLECLLLGLNAKRVSLADEINRFTKKAKMPEKLLVFSLKYLSPAVLFFMTVWGYAHLITDEGGLYGGYSIWLNIFGWILGAAVLASGFIICGVDRIRKNRRKTKVTALALTK